MTTWPLPIWQIVLTMVPFFVVDVIVTVIVFARVHPHKRVRLRFKRPALSNAREGLEWKIPGLVIGITWFLLISNFPVQLLSWFGINVTWAVVTTDPSSVAAFYPTRTSLTDFVVDVVLCIAMIVLGAFTSAWLHNLRIPATPTATPDPASPTAE